MKVLTLVLLLWGAVVQARGAEVVVFAAASLTDALEEIAPAHAKATGDVLRFNLGSSGTLARQIKEGAPADVFFSADEKRLDQLEGEGLLLSDTRHSLLSNTLVMVAAEKDGATVSGPNDLGTTKVRRIALGEPATVPAGSYAKEYLLRMGLWDTLQRKVVPLDNVRAVLAAVEAGNVDVGFVYQTDAMISKKVKVVYEVPKSEVPRISYPVAVVKGAKNADAGRRLVDFLRSADAKAVFERHGFSVRAY